MIRNNNWYQIHVGYQGVSDWLTREHYDILKMKFKFQRIISFSSSTHHQGQHRLNGTWYTWIWTSWNRLPLIIMGCTNAGGMSDTPRTAPITV